MKYLDLDQLQDQDQNHLINNRIKSNTLHNLKLSQSFMHFKERTDTNMTNEGALVPIFIENKIFPLIV